MILRRFNIGSRSIYIFSIILLIVISLGVVAFIQMGKLRDSEQEVETSWMPGGKSAGLMTSGLYRIRLEALRAATATDTQLRQQSLEKIELYWNDYSSIIRNHSDNLVSGPEERKLLDAVISSKDEYGKFLKKFLEILQSGDSAAAILFSNNSVSPVANELFDKVVMLRDFNDRGATAAGISASETYSTGRICVFLFIAVSLISTAVMGTLLVRSIVSPISEALNFAQSIAQKDLSKKITVVGQDEASRMLESLVQMQGNLRQTVGHIAESSTQLASASEGMSSVTEEAKRGLIRQNDEVNLAATAVTEMSAAVDEVALNAAHAAEASQHTQALTNSGLEHVSHTLSTIESLTENVGKTTGRVQNLSLRAQEISKVVEVIRSIAEQTNLLALNAAIEAARAGEQGRGFAVVADEVRALAHRTQKSTQEIEQMISSIQSDAILAVQAMEESQKMANNSTEVAQEANSSLRDIAEAILIINERNLMIATAAEEQAQVAREIDQNLTSIKDLSAQSATGSSQVAHTSGEVSKLAVGLNQMVSEFVI